ncbi:MAG: class I SAM-dependent methyltransferase [Deltaproteobacteria bacterium]|nr:class I SAM-dependent methyltransferase [Deltaproteobacteria bacterium]
MITVEFERLSIKPGFRILDMGCGSGRHTCAVSRFKEVIAIGSDIRFDDVVEARKRLMYEESLGEQDGGVWANVVSDIRCLPFEDNYFDLVICSEVLEHIDDHERAVSELSRVLKPGKDLVVSVPRYFPERICWALSKDYHLANDGHIRIYKKKELIGLLEAAGVKTWATHFAHSLHTPYWWLKCLVGPNRDDSPLVNLYHRFLVWDMMKQPWITRMLDCLLNSIIGKSVVIYLRKEYV